MTGQTDKNRTYIAIRKAVEPHIEYRVATILACSTFKGLISEVGLQRDLRKRLVNELHQSII